MKERRERKFKEEERKNIFHMREKEKERKKQVPGSQRLFFSFLPFSSSLIHFSVFESVLEQNSWYRTFRIELLE